MCAAHDKKKIGRTSKAPSLPPIASSLTKVLSNTPNGDTSETTPFTIVTSTSQPDAAPPTSSYSEHASGAAQPPQRLRTEPCLLSAISTRNASVWSVSSYVSAQDVYDAIIHEVPEALVTHVHDGQTGTASNLISIQSRHDFNKGFAYGVPSFIIVDSCQQSANVAVDMLSNQAGRINGVVIIVLLEHIVTKDWGLFIKEVVPVLTAHGADDVVLIPHDSTNMSLSISASMTKAGSNRTERVKLRRQIQALTDQINNLFWKIVHEVLPDFPHLQPELIEIHEKRVENMALVLKLGEGQFSSVYKWEYCVRQFSGAVKVFSEELGPSAHGGAVKIFPKGLVHSAHHALQMATEFAILQRLTHPNIVKSYQVLHANQNIYLFMEMPGTSNLFQHIRAAEGSKHLSWPLAASIISQIAAGLAHCHKMRVAHCGLEPKNIVISDSGCAKIVDFGQAVDLTEKVAPLNGILGTMPFIAPEVLWGCADWNPPAADIWSLAVIIVEILCGNGAFVRFLGWEDKDLMNVAEAEQRAIELMTVFAEEGRDANLNGLYDVCCVVPPLFVMHVLGDMLEIPPEKRIAAEHIVERIQRAWV